MTAGTRILWHRFDVGRDATASRRVPRCVDGAAVLVAVLVLGCALPLSAQELTGPQTRAAAPNMEAYRLAGPADIDLDGRLDDTAWERAEPITDFGQVEPREGAEPSERTEVRVVYDEDALYIGAKLFGDPGAILAYQRRRDAGLGTDDRFMWILDTFRDGRTGYFFEINPAGVSVLPGGYCNWEQSVSVGTAGRRPLSVDARLERGGFWDGDRAGWELGLTVRPLPGVSASLLDRTSGGTTPFTSRAVRA